MAQHLVRKLEEEGKSASKTLVKRVMKQIIPVQLNKEAKLSVKRAKAISAMASSHLGQPLSRPINQTLSKALSCKLSNHLARGYVKPPPAPLDRPTIGPFRDLQARLSSKQQGALAAKAAAQALHAAKSATLREKARRTFGVPMSNECAANAQDAPGEESQDSDDEMLKQPLLSAMEEREQARRRQTPRGLVRSSREVHEAAQQLVSSSAISHSLKIRKQAPPAIAALASTDACLLSDHGAVNVLLDMLRHNPNLSIQADCLDALYELVRWDQDACIVLVEQQGISLLLDLGSSASLRVRAQAVQVLSLVLLNPKKFPKLKLDDFSYSDEILRGLCHYVEQPCSSQHAVGVEQVSYQAASLIRQLSQALSARGRSWECMSTAFSAPRIAPKASHLQVLQALRRTERAERIAARRPAPNSAPPVNEHRDLEGDAAPLSGEAKGRVSSKDMLEMLASSRALSSDKPIEVEKDAAEWHAVEDVPKHMRWLSGALGGTAHAGAGGASTMQDGLNHLVKILTGGKLEEMLHESFAEHSVVYRPSRGASGLSGAGIDAPKPPVVSARTKCQLLLAVKNILPQSHSNAHSGAGSATNNKGAAPPRARKSDAPMSDQLTALDFILRKTHLGAVLTSLVRTPLPCSAHPAPTLDQPFTSSTNGGTCVTTWEVEMQVSAFETLIHIAQAIRTHSAYALLGDSLLHLSHQIMIKKKDVLPFKWMNSVELSMLAERSCPLYFSAGDVVMRQDDWCRSIYLVLSGELQVSCLTKGGSRSASVSRLSGGHLWGQTSFFIGESSLFTVTCQSAECTLLMVTRESLRSLLAQNPELELKICKHVSSLLHAQDKLALHERQERIHMQHDQAMHRPGALVRQGALTALVAPRSTLPAEGKAERQVRLRREHEDLYAGSNEETKTLMHVCFCTTLHLVLKALPLAKVYIARAVNGTVSLPSSSAISLSSSAAPAGVAPAAQKAVVGVKCSSHAPPHRPRSAVARPSSASGRAGQWAGAKDSEMQTTWSQATGGRVHQGRHLQAPAWTALEFVQQLLRLERGEAVWRAGILAPIADLLLSSQHQLAARAYACLCAYLEQDGTQQYLVDAAGAHDRPVIDAIMHYVLTCSIQPGARSKAKSSSMCRFLQLLARLSTHPPLGALVLSSEVSSAEHGQDHGVVTQCAKEKESKLNFHRTLTLVHLVYCGLAACSGSGKPMLLQSLAPSAPLQRAARGAMEGDKGMALSAGVLHGVDCSYTEAELLLALLQLLIQLTKPTKIAELKKWQLSALHSLSHRLAGKSAELSDSEEEDDDPTDTREECKARAERRKIRREAKQKESLSGLINCLELHAASCIITLGGRWHSPAHRITSHLNTRPGALSYSDASEADVELRQRVQFAFTELDLLLQTVHLEDAKKYHNAAKSLNTLRGMTQLKAEMKEGHLMSFEQAAIVIQKRARGIRGRQRFWRLKIEREKAVLAKMQRKPVYTEELAAIKIQTVFRGVRERKRFKERQERQLNRQNAKPNVAALKRKGSVQRKLREQEDEEIQKRVQSMHDRRNRTRMRQVVKHDGEVREVAFQGILHVTIDRIEHVTDEVPDKTGGHGGHHATEASVVCDIVCLELGSESFATACKSNAGGTDVLFQETSHKFCFKKSLDESMLKVKVLDKNEANHELLGQATLNLHAAEDYYKNSPQPLEMCNSNGQKVRKVYLSFSRTVRAMGTEHGEAGMVPILRSESQDRNRVDASRDDVGVPSWQLRHGSMVSDSSMVSHHSFLPYFPATPEGEEPYKDRTAVHAFPAKLKTSKLQLAARGAQLSVGFTMASAREKSSQGDEPCMEDAARRLSERRSVLSDFFVTAFARADDDWRTNHCWLSGGFSPPAHRT
jgi:CRP-like cAMP-binding protein